MAPAQAGFAPLGGGALLEGAAALDEGLAAVGWSRTPPHAQLQALLPHLGWTGADTLLRGAYADEAALALPLGTMDAGCDNLSWLGHAVHPAALERALAAPLAKVDKQAVGWARAQCLLLSAARALPPAEKFILESGDFIALPAFETATPAPGWMDQITWGLIRRSAAGLRTAAVLEYYCGVRGGTHLRGRAPRDATATPDTLLLNALLALAIKLGWASAASLAEDKARAAVKMASALASMPRELTAWEQPGAERRQQLDDEYRSATADGGFDGASEVARSRLLTTVEACEAHVVSKVSAHNRFTTITIPYIHCMLLYYTTPTLCSGASMALIP